MAEKMKKILVVDNHPLILSFMRKLLEGMGHEVLTAENGLAALDILEFYRPDVMFIDLVMPRIDGRKLCRIVRRMPEMQSAFIIILSAVASEEELDFISLGANACIAKGPPQIMKEHISALLNSPDFGASSGLLNKTLGYKNMVCRQISKELLQAVQHYQTVLRHLSEGIIELTSDERIIFVNSAAALLIGMPEEALLGSKFTELFQKEVYHKIMKILHNGIVDAPENPDYFTVLLNGTKVELRVIPMDECEENAKIVIMKDVTRQKKMEEQLRYAQKMEAVGTLSGGIAHDFNNILMGIQGNISLALLNLNPENDTYPRLKNIENYISNGANLTRQLLEYSRGGKYEVKATDLNKLIKRQVDLFSPARKEITIIADYEDNVWTVNADQGQIEQVLLNLLVNSSQAIPGCGKIYIKTENVIVKDGNNFPFRVVPGKYVCISVADTGTGIEPDIMSKIFDPFFTTKDVGIGTGLGLASAYGIIKNHDGFIDVRSAPGKGAAFRVYLPVSKSKVKKEREISTDIAKSDGTIMLVDDEEMILEVGREVLEYLGYSVITAGGGKEALELMQQLCSAENKAGGIPDLVILDMIMPDMDGGDVFDALKKISPGIKVILSSGYSANGKVNEIMERGCSGFIQKPFGLAQLSEAIRSVLGD